MCTAEGRLLRTVIKARKIPLIVPYPDLFHDTGRDVFFQ